MNCQKARGQIPLLAGGDLPARKGRHLRGHLKGCPGCQKELEEYQAALAGIKALARAGVRDWQDAEWKALMAETRAQQPAAHPLPLRLSPKVAWVYGAMLVLAFGLAAIFFKSAILKSRPLPVQAEIMLTRVEPARTFNPEEEPDFGRINDELFLTKREKSRPAPGNMVLASSRSEGKAAQDLLSMTLVSQETGLRVYWTFDKNFEWKEEKR
jgi:hypothetical protein